MYHIQRQASCIYSLLLNSMLHDTIQGSWGKCHLGKDTDIIITYLKIQVLTILTDRLKTLVLLLTFMILVFLLTADCNCFQENQKFSDTQKQARFCYLTYVCRGQSPAYRNARLVMICIYLFCKFPTFNLETNIKRTVQHIKVKCCRLFKKQSYNLQQFSGCLVSAYGTLAGWTGRNI